MNASLQNPEESLDQQQKGQESSKNIKQYCARKQQQIIAAAPILEQCRNDQDYNHQAIFCEYQQQYKMEFTEVKELDYIVAQSMSRNIFAGTNHTSNKHKSGKYDSTDSQDDDSTEGFSRQSNNVFHLGRASDNSQQPLNNILKNDEEVESVDDIISQINSLVTSQYQSKRKILEAEEERVKQQKEKELLDKEEQARMGIIKTESVIIYKKQDDLNEEERQKNGEQEKQEDGLEQSGASKTKEKHKNPDKVQNGEEESEEEEEEEDDDDEEDEEYDHKKGNNDGDDEDNDEDNTDKFEQVPEEFIQQSFNNVVLKQVSMLKNTTQKTTGGNKMMNNPKAKRIDVYFFGTMFNMKIPVDDQTTIREFLKIIIEAYMADPNSDKQLMRYPKYPHAYELRIKDDESAKPDPSLPPFEAKYNVQNFNIESVVFMEIEKFKPPVNNLGDQFEQKLREISSQKGLEVLSVKIEETGSETLIQMSSSSTIKDVLEYLRQKKFQKIVNRDCIVSNYDPAEDKYNETDLNTPISKLTSTKLRIKKKEWADTPRQTINVVQYAPSFPVQPQQSEPISNMNLVKYEEFSVIKINDKGRKQERVLGIDQHKILNINKRIQAQSIGFLDKIFVDPRTGTKNPSRQIEDIQHIQELENNMVIMRVKGTQHQTEKTLRYVIENPEDRRRIIKKVEGIMELQKQLQQKQFMNNNMMTYSQNQNQYGTKSLR